jgi:hypothetical protein
VSDSLDSLILDLLEWLAQRPRPYAEVLEAWRTSCPRLAVWEEATDRGFVARSRSAAGGVLVSVTPAGTEHLRDRRAGRPGIELAAREPAPARAGR